ncbi:MAG: phosphatidylglycerophosphatase A [Desulfatibacillaceae bacterium]|nr:phosphatidylglycerophosphatase A [Desulfatibacillaceae bacterium]
MSNLTEKVRLAQVTAFGLGLAPFAPGTFGTLLGVLVFVFCGLVLQGIALTLALAGFFVWASAACVVLNPWAQKRFGRQDPPQMVADEVAGYLLVPILFPGGPLWICAAWAFVLFRLFDILKPPPARQVDRRLHSGWGVLLDDLVAGFYAAVVMYILAGFAPWSGLVLG